jgi:hypothetical protein
MVETILDKVQNIEQEVKNTQDFHRLDELVVDLEKKLKETPDQEMQQFGSQIEHKIPMIHSSAILTLTSFSVAWETRKTEYKDKQLEDGEKLAGTLLEVLSRYGSADFPANVYGDDYVSKSEASLNTLKTQIEEEKRRRKNPDDEPNLKEEEKKILSYFREHGIESIRLKNNKLVIKYNFKEEEEEDPLEEGNKRELLQIYTYCQAKGINSLTLKDLEKINANQEPGYGKILFYGGIAVAVVLIVGLIVYLVYRSEKNRSSRY